MLVVADFIRPNIAPRSVLALAYALAYTGGFAFQGLFHCLALFIGLADLRNAKPGFLKGAARSLANCSQAR